MKSSEKSRRRGSCNGNGKKEKRNGKRYLKVEAVWVTFFKNGNQKSKYRRWVRKEKREEKGRKKKVRWVLDQFLRVENIQKRKKKKAILDSIDVRE